MPRQPRQSPAMTGIDICLLRLKEDVDKWGDCRIGQQDEDAQNNQDHDDRRQPPFFVATEKVEELANDILLGRMRSRTQSLDGIRR